MGSPQYPAVPVTAWACLEPLDKGLPIPSLREVRSPGDEQSGRTTTLLARVLSYVSSVALLETPYGSVKTPGVRGLAYIPAWRPRADRRGQTPIPPFCSLEFLPEGFKNGMRLFFYLSTAPEHKMTRTAYSTWQGGMEICNASLQPACEQHGRDRSSH